MSERVIEVAEAAEAWAEKWAGGNLARDIGEALTCSEADAIVGLLLALGLDGAAGEWRTAHAEGDEEGDRHWTGDES